MFSCLSNPYLILANFNCNVYFRKAIVQKSIFLSFSFLECADTSRNDLELESEWKRLTRALTMQANISGRTMDAGNHELVRWQTYIYEPRGLKVHFQARYARLQFFTLRRPTLSRLITCLSSFQVGLFTQLCHWIGLNAFYKPWLKNLTCERTQILNLIKKEGTTLWYLHLVY